MNRCDWPPWKPWAAPGMLAAVATLVEAATAGGEVKRVAQRSLLRVPGDGC